MVTPVPVKPLTGSLNTTVKLMGDAFVGSGWPAAWLIVTVGATLSTVTVTGAEVVRLPAASRAIAAMVCEPLLAPVVFQGTEYGAAVISAPALTPSNWNCTPTTPTLSEALALTVIVPETVAPEAGEVMLTDGAVASKHTLTAAGAEAENRPRAACRATPAASVAITGQAARMQLTDAW